jgi:hypothetical protein
VTLIRRVLQRKKIWEAHREHYYQRLVLIGWGHRRTALAEYGVMILCGGLAIVYHHATDDGRLVVLGAWVVLFITLGGLVNKLEQRQKVFGRKQDPNGASDEQYLQNRTHQTFSKRDHSDIPEPAGSGVASNE